MIFFNEKTKSRIFEIILDFVLKIVLLFLRSLSKNIPTWNQ